MFLKEIQLINFKCHKDLTLNFETGDLKHPVRKTTFLLGENGTGKSALLKAIALVTAGSNALGDLLSAPDEWIHCKKQSCEIRATLTTVKNEERSISLRIDRGKSLSKIMSDNIDSLAQIDEAIEHADRNYFVLGYGASRRLNKSKEPSFSSQPNAPRSARLHNIQSIFNADAVLVSLSNWAMDLDYTTAGVGVNTVKKALDTFLVENVKFKEIDRGKKQLIFRTPDGDMPLDQLSDGYQNVAAWVGDLMYRINTYFANFKDPLIARGLLLIDEVDLHLHPTWQRQLHAFLSKKLPNFQVIATTHSPITAQQADENELYALRRDRTNIEIVPFRGAPNKQLLHEVLLSPVFGLKTDESLKVENAKAVVREHTLKNTKDAIPAAILETVRELPMNLRQNSVLGSADVKLLRSINRQLSSKSKNQQLKSKKK